jgi:hypothetical protein
MKKIKFGIFGNGEVIIDDDGFIEIPVIIQESGLFAGRPPAELRIYETGIYGDDEFNKQYVAKLNRETDLPFYLTTAKIKVLPGMVEWTDKMLIEHNIKPLGKKEAESKKEETTTMGDLLRKTLEKETKPTKNQNPTLGDLIRANLVYTKDSKKYRKIGRHEKIAKGAMQTWTSGSEGTQELRPVLNPRTIGDIPAHFAKEREFFNPL